MLRVLLGCVDGPVRSQIGTFLTALHVVVAQLRFVADADRAGDNAGSSVLSLQHPRGNNHGLPTEGGMVAVVSEELAASYELQSLFVTFYQAVDEVCLSHGALGRATANTNLPRRIVSIKPCLISWRTCGQHCSKPLGGT